MANYTSQYPRADFQRPNLNWKPLDGEYWDFIFDFQDVGLMQQWHQEGLPEKAESHSDDLASPSTLSKRKILVPFAFQTPASGIGLNIPVEVLWYERTMTDIRTSEELRKGHRLVLRFGAVDYEATVWVDGRFVGSHRGGHVPFDLDVSDAWHGFLTDEQEGHGGETVPRELRLTVRVRDSPHDRTQPRGKQYWDSEPESIWYTPTSGIWQSVWLESLPGMCIGDSSNGTILRSDDIEAGTLRCKIAVKGRQAASKCSVEIKASLGGTFVRNLESGLPAERGFVAMDLDMRLPDDKQFSEESNALIALKNQDCWRHGLALWSPEHPVLYDITIRLLDASREVVDEVKTYAGMRSINWTMGDGTLRLNGKPYFQALVLDQGYWPRSGMTPPALEWVKQDVELAKKMGFNGCRKHQKVEVPLFMYWADKLGFLVWGEMANAQDFDEVYVERFNQEWMEAVRRDINHPSVVAWTPVNESWGYPSLKESAEQRNHLRTLYYLTKTLDPTRPVNDNCGWESVLTDLTTFHDYADAPELEQSCATMQGILSPKAGREMFVGTEPRQFQGGPGAEILTKLPVLCTEFGGVNITTGQNTDRPKDWGYTTATSYADLLNRFEKLIMAVVKGGHCCGFVYTQLTDIEQEVNGLYHFAQDATGQMTPDRIEKIDADRVKSVIQAAARVYFDHVSATGV